VEISPSIIDDSRNNGYEVTDFYEYIYKLIDVWITNTEIAIYTETNERQFGRAKSSEKNAQGDYIMEYHNVLHVRLSNENDPLLILKLKLSRSISIAPTIFVAYISDHNQMFGLPYEKNNYRRMKEIRKVNSDKLP
jgi:hypothetical protein